MIAFLRLCIVCVLFMYPLSSGNAQHLYLSHSPNLCAALESPPPVHYYIYAHSRDDTDFLKASFRLDTSAFNASDIEFVSPMPGVTVLPGDIFSGITVEWIPRALEHHPLLEINLHDTVQPYGTVRVTDATMTRPGGTTVAVEDKESVISTDYHCSVCLYKVDAPDTADVIVGDATTVRILLGAGCDGAMAAVFDVMDTETWVDSWTPTGLYLPDYCGACFWEMKPVDIKLVVPQGTPAGTLSEVLVANTDSFMARAVAPVPVKKATWGQLKAMHAE